MSALDSLTACVTTFRRPERLAKCLASIAAAGISNVVVCDGEEYGRDMGCNATWMVAAYRATTKRVLLIHDDDLLDPSFGEAYETVIGPCLDKRDAGWASWDAEILYENGTKEAAPYFAGGSAVMPSEQFLKVLSKMGQLTYSPCVSIFNRAVLIRACKEAEETLTANASLERPGMLLGTEILVYMRHAQAFRRWLHLDRVLSYFGHHEGSGTVKHQEANTAHIMVKGYDLARAQGLARPPEPTPRILLTYSKYEPAEIESKRRQDIAQESWSWHFGNADVIEIPHTSNEIPTIKEVLDHACKFALAEDIILYVNADAGLTARAVERICEGVARGNGVTCLGTHDLSEAPGVAVKSVANHKLSGGIDGLAVTPQWWKLHRDRMPDMVIGHEGWDACFAALAEEWADGVCLPDLSNADLRARSKAHTRDVIWHVDHRAPWEDHRFTELNKRNRELGRAFFRERGHTRALEVLK